MDTVRRESACWRNDGGDGRVRSDEAGRLIILVQRLVTVTAIAVRGGALSCVAWLFTT